MQLAMLLHWADGATLYLDGLLLVGAVWLCEYYSLTVMFQPVFGHEYLSFFLACKQQIKQQKPNMTGGSVAAASNSGVCTLLVCGTVCVRYVLLRHWADMQNRIAVACC